MTLTGDKSAALDELYSRITRFAEVMGGTASRTVLSVSVPAAMVSAPRSEDARPWLQRCLVTFGWTSPRLFR